MHRTSGRAIIVPIFISKPRERSFTLPLLNTQSISKNIIDIAKTPYLAMHDDVCLTETQLQLHTGKQDLFKCHL